MKIGKLPGMKSQPALRTDFKLPPWANRNLKRMWARGEDSTNRICGSKGKTHGMSAASVDGLMRTVPAGIHR